LSNASNNTSLQVTADTLALGAGTYLLTTINNTTTDGPNGLPLIISPLIIHGVDAETTAIARDPQAPPLRLLHVAATGTLTVQGIILTGGAAASNEEEGGETFGGVVLNAGGRVKLIRCWMVRNRAGAPPTWDGYGGGMANFGVTASADSLLTDNIGAGLFGGVEGAIYNPGTMTITNSLIADNGTAGSGAGIFSTGTLTLLHSTVHGNRITQGSGAGIDNRGLMTSADTTISKNETGNEFGGGRVNGGTLVITNSTIAQNAAGGDGATGGGIANFGTTTLTSSTIAGNRVDTADGEGGGGLFNHAEGGTLIVQNTIVARNHVTAGREGPDCLGPIISLGHNLIGDPTGCSITLQPGDRVGEPGLSEFTADGTPGHGHYPLLATSPAVNAGEPPVCPPQDQLGNPRSGPCDIGAIEFQPPTPPLPPALALRLNQRVFLPGQPLRVTLDAENPGPSRSADFSLAVLLPDAVTTLFITQRAPLIGRVTTLSDPATFRPLFPQVRVPHGLEVSLDDLLPYTFHGVEPSGAYHLIAALSRVGAFGDGSIDAGDVLAMDSAAFQVNPGGTSLYARMQAIRGRHLARAHPSGEPAD
jgi:hypothetical protein